MLTTASDDWDQKFRLWRHHGMSVPDTARHEARKVIAESYPILGYNYRMTDIQAAVGREQLERLPGIVERRRQIAARYHRLLADLPGVGRPEEPPWARSNWQSYCIRLPEGCDQRAVMQRMLDSGVATRRGVMCAHREAAYPIGTWSCGVRPGGCSCAPWSCQRLAHSEQAQDQAIMIPLFPQMTETEQDSVVSSLREAIAP
jgi:dTDP-4-amino-4,6-dideoxygalactose transaminase